MIDCNVFVVCGEIQSYMYTKFLYKLSLSSPLIPSAAYTC